VSGERVSAMASLGRAHSTPRSNLIIANRSIFAEPVWAKDVEAQAVKASGRRGRASWRRV
jgi:hypothetical protein